jgi:LmbE family N-acetylglucosaminyl deacetylase
VNARHEPAGGVLFLLAHHDDEVFCAGRLERARRQGQRIRLLWATAGGFAPAGRRRREGLVVARRLGSATDEHLSLGLPVQGALDHRPEIAEALRSLIGDVTGVYVPAYEGGHLDHDAVNLVAARVCAGGPPVDEFSLYCRQGRGVAVKRMFAAEPGPPERFLLDRPALELRRSLIRANASQLPELAALGGLAAAQGRWKMEPLRRLPDHDYGREPGGERPLYESYTRRRFGEFRAAAEAFSAG